MKNIERARAILVAKARLDKCQAELNSAECDLQALTDFGKAVGSVENALAVMRDDIHWAEIFVAGYEAKESEAQS